VENKVAIFIDGSNLYHGLKNNFRRQDVNFTGFVSKLCGTRPLYRVYYYNVLQDATKWPDTHKEQQEFLDVINRTPYLEVRLGTTKVAQGLPVEKGVDIMLATDLLLYGWHNLYDVAILVSGDADFAYALQTIKNMGKYVEIAYFENAASRSLIDIADNKHLMDASFFNNLWAAHRNPKRRRIFPPRPKIQKDTNTSTNNIPPK
jgi:uncharacterized LabA/DUF88 family protein